MNINSLLQARGRVSQLEQLYFSDQTNLFKCTDQLIGLLDYFPALKSDKQSLPRLCHLTGAFYSMKEKLPLEKQEKITMLFQKLFNLQPTRIESLQKRIQPVKNLVRNSEIKAIIHGNQKYPVPIALLKHDNTPCRIYFKSLVVQLKEGLNVEVSLGLLAYFSEKIRLKIKRNEKIDFLSLPWLNSHELDSLMAFLQTSEPAFINEKNAFPLMYAGVELQISELIDECKRYIFPKIDIQTIVFLLNNLNKEKNQTIIYQLEKYVSKMFREALIQQPIPQAFLEKLVYFQENLKSPITLSLSGISLTDDALLVLKDFPLNELELLNCHQLTLNALSIIETIPAIKSLKLGGCQWINDAALSKIPSHVDSLSVAGCTNFTKNGLINLQHTHVRNLDITGCNQLMDSDLAELPDQLEALDLRLCKGVEEKTAKRLSELSHLRHLVLASTPFKDEYVEFLSNSFYSLDLSECNLSDVALKKINQMKDLKELSVAGSRITDAGLTQLPDSIIELRLDFCREITNEGVKVLINHKNLKKLSLFDCPYITGQAIQKFSATQIQVGWQPSHL